MSKREDYIKPVDIEGLISAARQGQIDKSSEELLKSESEYIEAWRIKRGAPEQNSDGSSSYGKTQDNLIGLGLSGGGIRSATFSLGVMQALAKEKLFKYIDYLSTVSGGGYIGSSITWLSKCMAERCPNFSCQFPYGTGKDFKSSDPDSGLKEIQEKYLKFLRGHGITTLSLIGVILRGTILTFLVWFLFSTIAMYTSISFSQQIPIYHLIADGSSLQGLEYWSWYVAKFIFIPDLDTWFKSGYPEWIEILIYYPISLNLIGLSLIGVVIFLLLSLSYSTLTWFSGRLGMGYNRSVSLDSIKYLKSRRLRYFYRRLFERATGRILGLIVIFFMFGSLPIANHFVLTRVV